MRRRGPEIRSAEWPHPGLDLAGKRVAQPEKISQPEGSGRMNETVTTILKTADPNEVAFLRDKSRIKRYVEYIREKTGQSLTEEQASKNLDQYGAALADEQWAKINGRDIVTEDFIKQEAIASGQFYRDQNGVPHSLFQVSLAEYKNEIINLRPLFDAYASGDPNIKALLNDNFDPSRLADFNKRFRAGQVLGLRDASKNAGLVEDTGTILSGVVNLPFYLYDSLTNNEIGPFDSERQKTYHQALLKLQGRAEEAGYLSEYDFATEQRLTVLGLPLAELGGTALSKVPGAIKSAGVTLDQIAEKSALAALLKSGGVIDRATGQSVLNLKQLTTQQKATAGELFGEYTVKQIVPEGQKLARAPGPGETGIDDLYKVNRSDVDYVVIEYKFDTSRQGLTKDGLQGAENWILGSGRLEKAVGLNQARDIRASIKSECTETWLVRTLADGSTEIKVLDSAGKPKNIDTSKILLPGRTGNGAKP